MRKRKPIAEINTVPYIDVMLVLLVIFMITTPLLTQGVQIQLPEAKAQQVDVSKQTPLILSVDAKGKYFLNVVDDATKPLNAKAMLTRVAAEVLLAKKSGSTRSVLVRGDKDASYQTVVTAMVLLKRAGVKQVGLLTTT